MAIILKNHPELVSNYSTYRGIADFVDGSKSRVSGYLIRYQTESPTTPQGNQAFSNRLDRLYNVNYCEPYLTLHLGHLSQKIFISPADSEALAVIKSDCTGYGQDYLEVAREMLWYYMRDGMVGVLVERDPDVAPTIELAQEANERSYQVVYQAKNIRNWSHFEDGRFKGKLKELLLDAPAWSDKSGTFPQIHRYQMSEMGAVTYELLRSRDQSGLSISRNAQAEFDVIEFGALELEEIPFVFFGSGPDESYLKSVWELNIALLNQTSILSNCNYNQGFQRSFVAGASEEEVKLAGEFLISLLSNPDATIHTIPAGLPEATAQEIAVTKNELNRRAKFEFNQLADDTRQVQSAESKEKDMRGRVGIYNYTLDLLEKRLTKIYQLHSIYEGEDPEAVSVVISRDYGLEDETLLQQDLSEVFAQARELGALEVQKAVLRTRIRRLKLVPKPDQTEADMLAELDGEIETATGKQESGLASAGFSIGGALSGGL